MSGTQRVSEQIYGPQEQIIGQNASVLKRQCACVIVNENYNSINLTY